MQLGYYLALGAVLVCVLWKGTGPMRRTILTILGVALFSLTLAKVGLWPSDAYAYSMIAADTAALLIITRHPADKMQSVIGLTYIFQITTWIAYLASRYIYGRADMNVVWWGLTVPAILQLILVGGWIGGARAARYWGWSHTDPLGANPHSSGVAR